MAEDYTPTTGQVRVTFGYHGYRRTDEAERPTVSGRLAEFDRWLAAHDAETLRAERARIEVQDDVIERAARVLTEALFERSPYLNSDQNDAARSGLFVHLRDIAVPALAAAGLLRTEPDDAARIAREVGEAGR